MVTISALGNNDNIFFEVAQDAFTNFASIIIQLSKIPTGYVKWCLSDTPLKNFPDAPDHVRIWKFIKHGFEGITITCNGVVVADIKFGEARMECSSSPWKTKTVDFIKFHPYHDDTVAVGIRGT